MGAEMLVVPALDEPEHNADSKRDGEQHADSAEETEGEHAAYDRPPCDTRIPCNRNPQASAVERLSEIDHLASRASNSQRGHPRIQRSLGHALRQTLQCGLLKSVA